MSNRKGGPGGRKPRANKNKQAKGSSSPSSALSNGQQFPRDECHNRQVPCCKLLLDSTTELVSLGPSQENKQQQTQRPISLLGRMIRNHLLEKRKRELANSPESTNQAASANPGKKNKKRKNKKKKKGNNSNNTAAAADAVDNPSADGQQEADETDSTSVITSTVSQDSQAPSAPVSSSSARSTSSSTAMTSSMTSAATTASSTAEMVATTPSTTPVDLYLDRLQLAIQQQEQQQGGDTTDATKGPLIRDIDAFLKYLNEKHVASKDPNAGIVITQQELQYACQSMLCPVCKQEVSHALHGMLEAKQPVLLPAISFEPNAYHIANNHNGLAVPIHNQKSNAPPPPPPTVDFDYVAMEEGSSPMGTLLEAKADMEGIPYFHPHVLASSATDGDADAANNNATSNSNKKQNKKGEDSNTKGGAANKKSALEWRFVSSSVASAAATATPPGTEGSPSQPPNQSKASLITIQDLEHVVKNLMLPIGVSPDELLGATRLSSEDEKAIETRVHQLDSEFNKEINIIHSDVQKYQQRYNDLDDSEESNPNDLAIMTYMPTYHDCDDISHKLIEDIVLDAVWDRLLWLSGSPGAYVFRHTPQWENMVAYLTDRCAQAIMGILEAVVTYETKLQEDIADNLGKIPDLFVHKGHRIVFRTMIETKLHIVRTLLETVRRASETMEEAWPQFTTTSKGGPLRQQYSSGLLLFSRRKWYVEQEFYRKEAEIRHREESGGGTKRGSSSPGSRGKASQSQHDQNQQHTSPSPYSGVNQQWFKDLATYGGDLLRGLIEFSKTVKGGRLAELREEQMIRCEKLLGLIRRVGKDCVAPVVEKDEKVTGYVVKDSNLLNQCKHLWTQIQQQHRLQQQQQLLAANGEGPSLVEQRRTAAQLTLSLLKLLRHLRKHVAEKCGPKETPLMPLKVFQYALSLQENGIDYRSLDMKRVSYDMLVGMAASVHTHQYQCDGGGAQPRITSLFLGLLYKKLCEQCSEWHAELAEQELLITMGETSTEGANGSSNNATGEPNSSGGKRDSAASKNGVNSSTSNATTPGKKKGKGKKKKKSATESVGEGSETKPPPPPGFAAVNEDEQQNNANERGASNSKNGQQKSKADAKSEKDGIDGMATEKSVDSKATAEGIPAQDELQDGATLGDAIEFSTVGVDEDMGVVDHSGTFLTAESYLVGRLKAVLNGSGSQKSGKKAKGSGLVVTI